MKRAVLFLFLVAIAFSSACPSWALTGKRFAANGLDDSTQPALVRVADANPVADREYTKRFGDPGWKQPGAVEVVQVVTLDGKTRVYNSLEGQKQKVFEYPCSPPAGTEVYVYQAVKTGNIMPVKADCANPLRLGQKPAAPVVYGFVRETSLSSDVDVDVDVHCYASARAEASAINGPIRLTVNVPVTVNNQLGGGGYQGAPVYWMRTEYPIASVGWYKCGDTNISLTQTAYGGAGGAGGTAYGGAGGSVGDICIANNNTNINQNSAAAAATSVLAQDHSSASGSSEASGNQKVK